MIKILKHWLHERTVQRTVTARLIVGLIPAACPFARTLHLGRKALRIPPLCKINPFYEELIELRFRAVLFLESEKTNLQKFSEG